MNVSNNNSEIFEHFWCSYFYKQPQKWKYERVRTKYIKITNLARWKLNGCLQKHLNVSNTQIRNIGTPANGFLFYKSLCRNQTTSRKL